MKTKHWIILIVVVLIILYRKKLAAWLDAKGAPTDDSLSASVNTPLANLTTDLKKTGKSISEIVLKMADKMIDTRQEVYAHDLIDNQPVIQTLMTPGQWIEDIYPMEDKIFANTRPRSGIKVKQDQGWWPYVMYRTIPLHERVPLI